MRIFYTIYLEVIGETIIFASKIHIKRKEMGEKMYSYKYPHAALTTDCVVFGYDGRDLHILLVERGIEPYKGSWALPGGFMNMDETVEECAKRELAEETNVTDIYLEQFHVFSGVGRDPRERVVTVAFIALVRKSDYHVIAGDDAARASWFSEMEMPPLAFDHREIITMARRWLKKMLRNDPIAFRLLDEKFTMSELQRLAEVVNNTNYDRRNFARKMISTGFIEDEGPSPVTSHNRTPELYRFNEKSYEKEQKKKKSRRFPFNFFND